MIQKIILTTVCLILLSPVTIFAQKQATEPVTTPTAEDTYQVKTGDVLDITVWNNDDLNMTVVVDMEGKIHYPFLGVMDAGDKTVKELEDIITDGLNEELIVNPSVSVRLNPQSRAYFVYGEVMKPGVYQFQGKIDVLKAIVMAGGFTPYASTKVKIIRHSETGEETEIKINTKKLMHAMNDRDEYSIEPGDTIIVNRSWF